MFHNRLTHTLEVAQIGRRLAEKLITEQPDEASALGGVDPEVVEAAALAHDLGHPPFGHIAEEELDELIRAETVADGFEGNPQTFRILTTLAVRHDELIGLNLTRATLNASIKYPWPRADDGDRYRKWAAYSSERELFDWVRTDSPGDDRKCVEAELMDWADDIAYAVHDLEDFYRAGLVPLDRLAERHETEAFISDLFARWSRIGVKSKVGPDEATKILIGLVGSAPVGGPYSGTREQRAALRTLTSSLVGRYVRAIRLHVPRDESEDRVSVHEEQRLEVKLLKELTWHYVIRNPALAAQQYGQRQVVRDLFGIFLEGSTALPTDWQRNVLPRGFSDVLANLEEQSGESRPLSNDVRVRVAADAVAALTDQQALDMHRRLTGHDPRSVFDPIVR